MDRPGDEEVAGLSLGRGSVLSALDTHEGTQHWPRDCGMTMIRDTR